MPNLNGFEATRRIKEELPATKVLILSGHENPFFAWRLQRRVPTATR
jgi:DNA-binding NarL/FixJ family response regulator